MTGPEQVSVNVADLRIFISGSGSASEYEAARTRLIAAIPEPEWEPTDDMRAKYRRACHVVRDCQEHDSSEDDDGYVDLCLRALHREGLL